MTDKGHQSSLTFRVGSVNVPRAPDSNDPRRSSPILTTLTYLGCYLCSGRGAETFVSPQTGTAFPLVCVDADALKCYCVDNTVKTRQRLETTVARPVILYPMVTLTRPVIASR